MDVFQSLLSDPQTNHVSAELLETLANQAARRHLDQGETLDSAITDLASQHSGLQNEHIKRIAEFANNAVFQEMHSKSEDKNVHFQVADPGNIIRDLKDGGSPAHDGKTLSIGKKDKSSEIESSDNGQYATPPENNSPGSEFDNAFQEYMRQDQNSGVEGTGEEISKTAAERQWKCKRPGQSRPPRRARQGDGGRPRPPRPSRYVEKDAHADPVEDVWDTHVRLQAAESKLKEANSQFDLLHKQAEEDFYREVKREVLNGGGMGEVIQCLKLASPNSRAAFRALRPVAERLVKEGALSTKDLEKTASNRVVNPEHPLVISFAGLLKTAEERSKSKIALREIQDGLKKTGAFIRGRA